MPNFADYGIGIFSLSVVAYIVVQLFTMMKASMEVIRNNTKALTELAALIRTQGECMERVACEVQELRIAEAYRKGQESK
jgi:ribosomal protein S12 methylthiotransferase accessory factor YcaO